MIDKAARTDEEKRKAACLIYTWQEVFCDLISKMLVTDLVKHRILPTKVAKVKMSRPALYSVKEMAYQHEKLCAHLLPFAFDKCFVCLY